MRFVDLIEQKKRDVPLTDEQIRWAIGEYLADRVPDYQMAALLMAIRWRGLQDAEVISLTEAMVESGERFDLSDLSAPLADKHSTGGVGDKVSLILAPLVACCGCCVPMVSGRGLGHTGGTLDKLESIPGFRTQLDARTFHDQLQRIGVAMGAQTEDFVPADRRLYALRDVTGTVDDSGLITASILSKKIAEGTQVLVLDVKVGSGAFFRRIEQARALADRLLAVAQGAGLRCSALLTAMEAPLGRAIGHALEVREAIAALRGEGPEDLREVVLALSAEMLVAAGRAEDLAGARDLATARLDSGEALERFRQLVSAQGGDPRVADDPEVLPESSDVLPLYPPAAGVATRIDARTLGLAAIHLRAGRNRKEDSIDPAAGLVLHTALGESVDPQRPWISLHYAPGADLERARAMVESALGVAPAPIPKPPLILERRP